MTPIFWARVMEGENLERPGWAEATLARLVGKRDASVRRGRSAAPSAAKRHLKGGEAAPDGRDAPRRAPDASIPVNPAFHRRRGIGSAPPAMYVEVISRPDGAPVGRERKFRNHLEARTGLTAPASASVVRLGDRRGHLKRLQTLTVRRCCHEGRSRPSMVRWCRPPGCGGAAGKVMDPCGCSWTWPSNSGLRARCLGIGVLRTLA